MLNKLKFKQKFYTNSETKSTNYKEQTTLINIIQIKKNKVIRKISFFQNFSLEVTTTYKQILQLKYGYNHLTQKNELTSNYKELFVIDS